MKRSRLRYYILISVLLHLLFFWLLTWLPVSTPTPPTPVAIRVLDTPNPSSTPPLPKPKQQRRPRPKNGGILAELPKPQQQERPDQAQIVSKYDSRAQDIGSGDSGTQKPSGQNPPQLPPELTQPERYSKPQPKAQSSAPRQTRQASQKPTAQKSPPPKRQPVPSTGTKSVRPSQKKPPPKKSTPDKRRFRISKEEEVAMLQRDNESKALTQAQRAALEDHFARLQRHEPLPTFDAPGTYDQGPERPGEGNTSTGGGKFRSIDAFGLKHFSYLVGVKRKIELVFSIPFFSPQQGRVGVPIVGFTIQRNGTLSEAVLLRSSGYGAIDQALIEAVKRAAPYGPFPNHLPDQEISIRVYATLS